MVDPEDGEPWDFNRREKREKALNMVQSQEPYILVGSSMCTAFCTWMALNRAKSKNTLALRRAYRQAVRHMEFVSMLYREQASNGRYFLHEHPAGASSWSLDCIKDLWEMPGVERVTGDQCQYGAEVVEGPSTGEPIKKPTGFLTNSAELRKMLNSRCLGGRTPGACSRPKAGHHVHCEGKTAKNAAIYPRELCRAIIKGVSNQLRVDGVTKNGCFGLQAKDDDGEISHSIFSPENGYSGKCRDDLTGQVLKDELVIKARLTELTFFHSKGVWTKKPMHRSREATGKPPISVRWVDVNKGDEINPNYRSRLVARQMKAHDHSGNSYFAPAPPLEALRTVLSLAVTSVGKHKPILEPLHPRRSQISFIDIKRAYFNAKINDKDPPTYLRRRRMQTAATCALSF